MNVLVLEKEDETRYVLGQILEESGHRVFLMRDVSDTLETLKKMKIDVAVVDRYSLPIEQLYQWSYQCSKEFSSMKIIILSTGTTEEVKTIKYNHFLKKPFDIDKFLELVSEK